MNNEEPLVPDFSTHEPGSPGTIGHARKKNENGLCAFVDCDNKLDDKPVLFPFGKLCPKHGTEHLEFLDRVREDIERDSWIMTFQKLGIFIPELND